MHVTVAGPIQLGASTGAMLAGIMAGALSRALGTEKLVLVQALLLLASLGPNHLIWRRERSGERRAKPEKKAAAAGGKWHRNPLILSMAFWTFAIIFCKTVFEYVASSNRSRAVSHRCIVLGMSLQVSVQRPRGQHAELQRHGRAHRPAVRGAWHSPAATRPFSPQRRASGHRQPASATHRQPRALCPLFSVCASRSRCRYAPAPAQVAGLFSSLINVFGTSAFMRRAGLLPVLLASPVFLFGGSIGTFIFPGTAVD